MASLHTNIKGAKRLSEYNKVFNTALAAVNVLIKNIRSEAEKHLETSQEKERQYYFIEFCSMMDILLECEKLKPEYVEKHQIGHEYLCLMWEGSYYPICKKSESDTYLITVLDFLHRIGEDGRSAIRDCLENFDDE